jgi:hypothetical protein
MSQMSAVAALAARIVIRQWTRASQAGNIRRRLKGFRRASATIEN